MDVELTPARQDRLAEAGYVIDPAPAPVKGRHRVRDGDNRTFDLVLVAVPDAARESVLAHVSRWFPVNDPDVEHLVDALDLDDVIGYITAPAAACTLATFVEDTGRLGAGHTSTLLVTLGRALARLHAQGVVYGPLTAQNVLVVAGRVVLAVPQPDLSPSTMAPSPQEDAYHLAVLADSVIERLHGQQAPDSPPPGLRGLTRLVVSALGDAQTRPGVGTLATLSHDLAPCLPLITLPPIDLVAEAGSDSRGGLDHPAPRRTSFRGESVPGARQGPRGTPESTGIPAAPRERAGGQGRLPRPGIECGDRRDRAVPARPGRRRHVVVLVLVVVVVALGVGAVVTNRPGGGSPAYAAGITESAAAPEDEDTLPAVAPEDPGLAAERLTRARMDLVVALTNAVLAEPAPVAQPAQVAEPAPLAAEAPPVADTRDEWAEVMLPGSAAAGQAAELVSGLRADGTRISGLTIETRDPVVRAQATGTAQVQLTFAISAYTLELASGAQQVPAGGPRTAVLDLVLTEGGWRVAGVAEAGPVD